MTLSGRHAARISRIRRTHARTRKSRAPLQIGHGAKISSFFPIFFFFHSQLGSFVPKASRELSELEPVLPVHKTGNPYYSSVTVLRTTIFKRSITVVAVIVIPEEKRRGVSRTIRR